MPDNRQNDEFDVLRNVVEQLTPLATEQRVMVVRWACEKLGIEFQSGQQGSGGQGAGVPFASGAPASIRTFYQEKNPQSDTHFAAVVAYYYRFLAPERKDSISREELQEATRLVNRERLHDPTKTMNNAASAGLLDNNGRGLYGINTVGENLVAVVLPNSGGNTASKPRKKPAKSGRGKRARK